MKRPPCYVCGQAAATRCDVCSPDANMFFCERRACFDKEHNAFIVEQHRRQQVSWDSGVKEKCCAAHPLQPLDRWCSECSVLACAACCAGDAHKGHATSLVGGDPEQQQPALRHGLQATAAQLEAEVEHDAARLQQLAALQDEAAQRRGAVGAAIRTLDDAEERFDSTMRALRAELETAAAAWHARTAEAYERLARRTERARTLAESMRAACDAEDEAAPETQRFALGCEDLYRQRTALLHEGGAPPPVDVWRVSVSPEPLAAMLRAVAGLTVVCDAGCDEQKEEGVEEVSGVAGCAGAACSGCGSCVRCRLEAEKAALPEDLRHRVVVPETVSPHSLAAAEVYSAVGGAWEGSVDGSGAALRLYQLACAIEEVEAPNSLALAQTYSSIGKAYWEQDDYVEARIWYNKARVIEEDKQPNSLALATTCGKIGRMYYKQSKYDKALAWYTKARSIEEDLVPNSLTVAATYSWIGGVFTHQSEYGKALTWLTRARVLEEELAPNSLAVATTYGNIGFLHKKQAKYAEALAWYTVACAIEEDKVPGSHALATTYNSLGNVYCSWEKHSDALEWYTRARLIKEEKTPNSLALATTYNNLGFMYCSQEKYDEAANWYKKACAIKESKPSNHESTARTYNNIGHVCSKQGRHEEARAWHNKAFLIQRE